jgi:hypothetical protein
VNEHTREPQIDRAATLLSEGNLENHLMYLENVYIASSVPEVSLRLMVRIFPLSPMSETFCHSGVQAGGWLVCSNTNID